MSNRGFFSTDFTIIVFRGACLFKGLFTNLRIIVLDKPFYLFLEQEKQKLDKLQPEATAIDLSENLNVDVLADCVFFVTKTLLNRCKPLDSIHVTLIQENLFLNFRFRQIVAHNVRDIFDALIIRS